MLKNLIVLFIVVAVASGQTWVSRARLNNFMDYWHTLMQELVTELERREWCNLKLNDIEQTVDDNLFNMRVNGTVRYTNGFVVSIQKIDLVDIQQLVTSRTIDGEAVPFGTVRGKLNFRDIVVGFDVDADLVSPEGKYRSTGTFWHVLVQLQLDITQNLITKETTSSPSVVSVSGGSGIRMQYMPSSQVMEGLGRRFLPNTFDSAGIWARNIIAPIMLDLATNKIEFPNICFNNCL